MYSFDLPPRRYAYDEIAAYPDEARRELDDGAPVLLYAPGLCPVVAHSRAVGALLLALHLWNENDARGETVLNCDWQIDKWNSVAPDLSFFAAPRQQNEFVRADGQCLIAAPDLVCEVWDERTDFNDTARKPALYARLGVPLFWLIHPQKQTVTVHQTPTANGYQARRALARNEVLESALLPEFRVPLDQILR